MKIYVWTHPDYKQYWYTPVSKAPDSFGWWAKARLLYAVNIRRKHAST
jgi:hypothetical protein